MNNLKVFIVDDDIDFAESLALLLEGRGLDIEIAYSGEEAIKKFKEQDFDITFMDVKLPGKNGVDSFLEIRKINPDARVVMMTGFSVEQLLQKAVDNGAWGVLDKPVDSSKILKILEDIKPAGILIVDDDPDFVASIINLLDNKNYRLFIAKNGQEALKQVKQNDIDILMLDLHMPIMNGVETYLEIKNEGFAIPTIIITAFFDEEKDAIEKLHEMSISGVLEKPFDPKELLQLINNLSESKKIDGE